MWNSFAEYVAYRNLMEGVDYGDFVKKLERIGLTPQDLVALCKRNSPDGQGGNADFYKIPGMDDYGLRILRSDHLDDGSYGLNHEDDEFPEDNFGQPIANLGNGVTVVKLQHGNPVGLASKVKGKAHFYKKSPELEAAARDFRERIREAAALPPEAYERICQQMMRIYSKNKMIDPSKAGNMLIHPEKGLGFVDLLPAPSENSGPSVDYIISMILDTGKARFLDQYFPNDPEVSEWRKIIINKAMDASKKTGLPFKGYSATRGAFRVAGIPRTGLFEPDEYDPEFAHMFQKKPKEKPTNRGDVF